MTPIHSPHPRFFVQRPYACAECGELMFWEWYEFRPIIAHPIKATCSQSTVRFEVPTQPLKPVEDEQ